MDKYKEDFKQIYSLDKQGLIDYIDRQEWMLDEDDSLGENDKLELITLIQTAKSRLTGSYEYVMNKRIKDGQKLRLKRCPFCLGFPIMKTSHDVNSNLNIAFVECTRCEAKSGTSNINNIEDRLVEARRMWNRRTEK